MCHLMKEQITTKILLKGLNPSLIKPLDSASICRESDRRNILNYTVSVQSAKFTLGDSSVGQMAWVTQ